MGMFDRVFARTRVIASTVVGKFNAVLLNLEGLGAGDDDPDAEGTTDEPLFGQLGVVARPRPPNVDGVAEAINARTSDGMLPIAMRDLRQCARFPAKVGDAAMVNDNGAFVSIQDGAMKVENGERKGLPKSATVTVFAPQLDDNGVVTKAHVFTLDSSEENNSITVVHSSGASMSVNKDGELTLRSDTGEARIILKGDQITMQAKAIIAQGNLVVGANPVGALPFAGGASMPPCSSLYLAP